MKEAPLRQRMLKFNHWVESVIVSTLDTKLQEEYRKMREAVDEDPKGPRSLPVKELSRPDVERIFALARNLNVDSVFPRPAQSEVVADDLGKPMLQRNDHVH
jgi:hypothetical protein